MLPPEVAGLHYLIPENQSLFPSNFANMPPLQHFTLPNYQNTADFSNNSTSDEAEDQYHHQESHVIIDERKQRRMISNRESARRSRMRKQRHLDELWSQVIRLRNENQKLFDKLNCAIESHEKVLEENLKLKEETSDLRQMMSDFQIGSPFSALRDLEEITCNAAHLKAESYSQSVSTSTNLLN